MSAIDRAESEARRRAEAERYASLKNIDFRMFERAVWIGSFVAFHSSDTKLAARVESMAVSLALEAYEAGRDGGTP